MSSPIIFWVLHLVAVVALTACDSGSSSRPLDTGATVADASTPADTASADAAPADAAPADAAQADLLQDDLVAGDGAADLASADGSAADSALPTASSFTFVSQSVATCPGQAGWCLLHWPPKIRGEMRLFNSTETHPQGGTHTRTFYLYAPTRATGPAPVLIMLHGGGGSALWSMAQPISRMADGRGSSPGISWERNTASCQYTYGQGFTDVVGTSCTPQTATYYNNLPFMAVYPEGILDQGSQDKRHWEDGRDPSPGHKTTAQQRDDVGFIDHIIEVLLQQMPASVDPGRIYLAGVSNGGMMVQRVLCNLENPLYPNLARIAAASPQIASMPEPIKEGLAGRESCPASGAIQLGIAFYMGKGIDTPNCVPFPCKQPTVSGDGLMPFGQAGQRYNIWSPDGGKVIGAPEAHNHFRDLLAGTTGQSPTSTVDPLGYFTEVTRYSFGGAAARLWLVITDGGHHMDLSSRMDFSVEAHAWSFLSSFSRDASGVLSYAPSTAVSGLF